MLSKKSKWNKAVYAMEYGKPNLLERLKGFFDFLMAKAGLRKCTACGKSAMISNTSYFKTAKARELSEVQKRVTPDEIPMYVRDITKRYVQLKTVNKARNIEVAEMVCPICLHTERFISGAWRDFDGKVGAGSIHSLVSSGKLPQLGVKGYRFIK